MLHLAKTRMGATRSAVLLSIVHLFIGSAAAEDWASIPGRFVQISIALDGTAAGVTREEEVYAWNGSWTKLSGALVQASTPGGGQIWGVNSIGQIWLWADSRWVRIPGTAKQISAASDGTVVAIDPPNVARYIASSNSWEQLPGGITQKVVAGNSQAIWGLNSDGSIYRLAPDGKAWTPISGSAEDIAVGKDGDLWALRSGAAYHWTGSDWSRVPGSAGLVRISAGNARTIWSLDQSNRVLRLRNPGPSPYWSPLPDLFEKVSLAADGTLMALDDQRFSFLWTGGSEWKKFTGALLTDISVVKSDDAWGLDGNYIVWRWDGSIWTPLSASGAPQLQRISAARDGTVVGLNLANDIFRYNAASNTWTQLPGKLFEISAGSADEIWGLGNNGSPYRWNGSSWDVQSGALKSISVSSDGEVWGVNSESAIWRWIGSGWERKSGVMESVSIGQSNRMAGLAPGKMPLLGSLDPDYCWKDTYGRGVGSIPGDCAFNEEKQGLLCYEKCKEGYTGFVASCLQNCPSGYTEDGLFCRKGAAYGRGVGYPWQFGDSLNSSGMLARCEAAEKTKCETCLAVAYPACKPGYVAVGCNICSPACPSGMTDFGVSCAKDTYFRDTLLPKCAPGEVYDAGLCYPACRAAYAGVGPVCWGRCGGATPLECAGGCAKDQAACAQHTGDMVLATVNSAISLASFAAPGLGGIVSAAVKQGLRQAALAAGKYAAATAGTKWTKEWVKQSLHASSSAAGVPIADTAANNWADVLTTLQNAGAGDTSEAASFFAKLDSLPFDPMALDITGLSGMFLAFTHPVCGK